jgi:hypothetical protein
MTIVSLNDLTNLSGKTVVPAPSINTSITFKTDGTPGSVPLTCQSIIALAKSSGTAQAFLNSYNLQPIITNLTQFNTALVTNNIDQNNMVNPTSTNIIQDYLNEMTSKNIPVLSLVDACIREAQLPVDAIAYNNAKQTLDTSKERLELIKTPEQRVSYYEGWFPLFRPMNRSALFGLFGTGLFLLLVSILLFLRLQGVEVLLKFPEISLGSPSAFSIPSSYKVWAGAGIIIGGLVGYFGYKWFSA